MKKAISTDIPIIKLINLGPKSAKWLSGIGIKTLKDLKKFGAIRAYLVLKEKQEGVSLNLLWAMFGAIHGISWNEIPPKTKQMLKEKLKK